MAIKIGSIGQEIYIETPDFEMSGSGASASLNLITPKGENKTLSPAVIGSSAVVVEGKTLEPNKYALYKTKASDVDVKGQYKARIVYEDDTPVKYFGDYFQFTVTE